MVRKISKSKYLVAGVITGCIFLLGLFLGLIIESQRIIYIEEQAKRYSLDFDSLQLQYAYMDQLSKEDNCRAVEKTFDENVKKLESTRIRLENYGDNAKISKSEFDLLRREYLLAEVRYWLLAKRSKEICGTDIVSILFFHSYEKGCPDCTKEAFILTYLKKKFGEHLLNFAIDADLKDEPLINILLKTYDINTFPTLIIESKKFEGLTKKSTILKEICSHYEQNFTECD